MLGVEEVEQALHPVDHGAQTRDVLGGRGPRALLDGRIPAGPTAVVELTGLLAGEGPQHLALGRLAEPGQVGQHVTAGPVRQP